jgi:signal transduction histidine kinase/CheY-like chemotaxis protein/methyl-accepting chemotaxis protein
MPFKTKLLLVFSLILLLGCASSLIAIVQLQTFSDAFLSGFAENDASIKHDDLNALTVAVGNAQSWLFASIAIFLLLSSLMIFWLFNALMNRIRAVSENAGRLFYADLQGLQYELKNEVEDEFLPITLVHRNLARTLDDFSKQLEQMAKSAQEGNYHPRIETGLYRGHWQQIAQQVNGLVTDATLPMAHQLTALQQLADGTFTQQMTEAYKGDHARMKDEINRLADIGQKAVADVQLLLQACHEGNIHYRLSEKGYTGDWKNIIHSFNCALDELITPVDVALNVLQQMANGHLTSSISETFQGDHARLKESINSVANSAQKTMLDIQSIVQASREGHLKYRVPVDEHQGDWKTIISSINSTIDQLLSPIDEQAAVLQSMAEGTLTAKLTENFKGDHNRIKEAINRVADVAVNVMNEFNTVFSSLSEGNYAPHIHFEPYTGDWHTILSRVNNILMTVHEKTLQLQTQSWIKTGMSELSQTMRGDMPLSELAYQSVRYLATYTQSQIGALYFWNDNENVLQLLGSYAYQRRKGLAQQFSLGEGLVGQAALEKQMILVTHLPEDYIFISSGLGYAPPHHLIVVPILYEGDIKGVIELGRIEAFDNQTIDLIGACADTIGLAMVVAQSTTETRQLLEQSQEQAKRLQLQQEELQQSNEELEEQTLALQASERLLKIQQADMQQSNEELEERTMMLEQQRDETAHANQKLEEAQKNLAHRAKALAQASKYKSEFLANMSHELRTPLNSLLLLSRTLADNREGNLTQKQVESAQVMYQSGSDLLAIIDDILDLSKIEAGSQQASIETVNVSDVASHKQRLFQPIADEKNLAWVVEILPSVPAQIQTDHRRLGQILRNLLSNAFKFTTVGQVSLMISKASSDVVFNDARLAKVDTIAFEVADTGIGIAKEKQIMIWDAFQQGDGTTNRQYGGTGLGLTISRELTRLLGGEIHLRSSPHQGSVFTLYLPVHGNQEMASDQTQIQSQTQEPSVNTQNDASHDRLSHAQTVERIGDDREQIRPDERVLLIVEDDPVFANFLANACRAHDIRYVATPFVDEALTLIMQYNVIGIFLDMYLPDKEGWTVLHFVKNNLEKSHIPICVLSVDNSFNATMFHGAFAFAQKPIPDDKLGYILSSMIRIAHDESKYILVVDDDSTLASSAVGLLGRENVVIVTANSATDALERMREQSFDLIVLDLGLPDMSGLDLLALASKELRLPPVIVYTGRDLTRKEYEHIQYYASSVIIKNVRSDERLLAEAQLLLHQAVERLPEKTKKMLLSLHDRDLMFKGKRVLLIDDDIRNIFSLSALLEDRGMLVATASNGQEALTQLELIEKDHFKQVAFDLIITDIMMPVMDGLELIRLIRQKEHYFSMPIIALTAKAMKEDRVQCLEAGASDYLNKPVDVERLFSMLRVWLYS